MKHVPCNNGRVGMWGISYPGFYVSAGMIDAHPALKAVSPQAPVTDYFMGDDSFHNGAFMLAANFGFYTNFPVRPQPDAAASRGRRSTTARRAATTSTCRWARSIQAPPAWAWPRIPTTVRNLEHTSYDDFWKARAIWRHFKNITPAVLTVGGWFDAEDIAGPLLTHKTLKTDSPPPRRTTS